RRRVTGRIPPEAIVVFHLLGVGLAPRFEMSPRPAIRAVVHAGNLAELQRVENDADIAVVGKPEAMILKRRLVPIAPLPRMAADINDGGQAFTPPGPPF